MTRVLPGLLLVVAIGLALGALWQAIAGSFDRRRQIAHGVMADAGGHRLFLDVCGRDAPGPTVLLDCGIGGATSRNWAWVQRGVARFAPVVSYDRAGLGASEPGPLPRDGLRLVAELHAALGHAGLTPPYVYVGHSYGGLLARLYADRHPEEIAGVVLVESSHPRQFPSVRRAFGWIGRVLPAAPWLARLGLMRAFNAAVPTDVNLLPEPERSEQRAYLARPEHWTAVVHELDAWFPLTSPEAARTHGFGGRPLVVLTAGSSARHWGRWKDWQQELAGLSSDAIHRVEPGATHGSIVADSTHAQAIVRAIEEVVRAARERRPVRSIAAERGGMTVRLDVALFGLRLFKSRSQAQDAIARGEVLLNGAAVRSSREISPGDRITLLAPGARRTYEVLELPHRSLSKDAAKSLLREVPGD